MRVRAVVSMAVLLAGGVLAPAAIAGTFESGSTGADGALNITTNTTLTVPPSGVWHYTTISISAGATLSFLKNAANTPITMLASGDVNILGTIDLSGGPGGDVDPNLNATPTAPNGGTGGPGGQDGGAGGTQIPPTANIYGSRGRGPGGGQGGAGGSGTVCAGGGGGFGSAGASGVSDNPVSGYCPQGSVGPGGEAYGTGVLVPLVGGSGGGGGAHVQGCTSAGAGGGGGALLIASSGTITLTGTIKANGGKGGTGVSLSGPFCNNYRAAPGGGGSGGAVRLVATSFAGTGQITVNGGDGGPYNGTSGGGEGGPGRIRVESLTATAAWSFSATPSLGMPGTTTLASGATLSISSVGGVAAPATPAGAYATPDITLPSSAINPMTVNLAAANIPLGTTVAVRVTPQVGRQTPDTFTSTALSGTLASSTATASVTLPLDQPALLDAEATFTLQAWLGHDAPIQYAGEAVTTVKMTASLGGEPLMRYYTASGREVPVDQAMALGLLR